MICCPKLLFAIGPHSPLALGLRRSQFGRMSGAHARVGVHDRAVFVTMALCGLKVLLMTQDTSPT